ncbi:MAG: hypothetical protein M1305_02260, partial [Candidatus Marsarchaeota archaeon]|nr:hypothetical protein [Candidatus Marsarchaeota archaeon]
DGVLVHRAPADAKEPSWYFLFAPPAFSPDGRRFVAPGNALIIWDLLTGRAYSVDTGAVSLYMATAVAFSPDGRSLAVGEDYFSRP